MRSLRALAAAAAVAAAAGCAGVNRVPEVRDFEAGRYAAARAAAEERLAEPGSDDADATLDHCLAGTAALSEGDVRGAHRHFLEAFRDMEDMTATTGETVGAIAGPERTKRWKGDPHERSMNAYYAGVTYWLLGDPDNAAACFKAGLLHDGDSQKGAAQSDFAALWFLLAMAQRDAHHTDRGEFALARARELLPENPWTDPRSAAEANVLVVADLGRGPRKVADGPHGSRLRIVPSSYRAAYAEVSGDGHPLGRTAPAVDVWAQAATRGGKTMDDVNAAKAAMKDVAVVGGAILADNAGNRRNQAIGAGLILFGLLLPAEADVRAWDTLPGEIHVLTAKLPPGEHVLRVEPRDAADVPIHGVAREIRVTVREGRVAFAWVRAGPPPAADRRIQGERGVRP